MENEKKLTQAQTEILNNVEKEFNEITIAANEESTEMVTKLVDKIVIEGGEKFNLTKAMLASAYNMSNLASYLYENEEEFDTDMEKAHEIVMEIIFPALLQPRPCEECENCLDEDYANCTNIQTNEEHVRSKFIPLIAAMMVEYDTYMRIVAKKHQEQINKSDKKEEEE